MKFAVTAGHDDKDPGNTANGLREADLMLELRHLVAVRLRAMGHTVVEDGERGVNLPLSAAVRAAAGVDVALELHTNAVANPTAEGIEIVAPKRHRTLSQALAHAIGGVLMSPTRKDKGWYDPEQHRKDRGWNNQAAFVRADGIIIETFFQSNPRELAAYQGKYHLVASAIARVLNEYALAKTSTT